MKKFIKFYLISFFFISLFTITIFNPIKVSAANPTSLIFTPQIKLSGTSLDSESINVGSYDSEDGKMKSTLLAKYILAFYQYGLSIVGILAAIMLMAGGVVWLTSRGNDAKIGEARELISGSIIGTLILICSWIILNTINPNLLQMQSIDTEIIKVISVGCCEQNGKAFMTVSSQCDKKNFFLDKLANYKKNICEQKGCCLGPAPQAGIYGKYGSCVDTTSSICKEKVSDGSFNAQVCSAIADCSKVTSDCKGITNGKSPLNGPPGDVFCYDGNTYLGKGDIGDPCGTEKGSKCDADVPDPTSGKACQGGSGGRSCVSGVWCCQFKSDGSRLNKT